MWGSLATALSIYKIFFFFFFCDFKKFLVFINTKIIPYFVAIIYISYIPVWYQIIR